MYVWDKTKTKQRDPKDITFHNFEKLYLEKQRANPTKNRPKLQ